MDFDDAWVSVTNRDTGLVARIAWNSEVLPYAWLWEELNSSDPFRWFGQARVLAIEPASTQTSGPDRRSVLRPPPGGVLHVPIEVSLRHEIGAVVSP